MKKSSTNITSMPQTEEAERSARMRKYLIMMGIRVACLLLLLWVRGPWMLLPAAGAIFLPYFAVIVANAVQSRRTLSVERPSSVELFRGAPAPQEGIRTDDGGAGSSRAPRSEYERDVWDAAWHGTPSPDDGIRPGTASWGADGPSAPPRRSDGAPGSGPRNEAA